VKNLILLALPLLVTPLALSGQQRPTFNPHEAGIARIHAEMKAGRLTCRALVGHYLRRIEAFDKQGPAINAIVVTIRTWRRRPTNSIGGSVRGSRSARCTACR